MGEHMEGKQPARMEERKNKASGRIVSKARRSHSIEVDSEEWARKGTMKATNVELADPNCKSVDHSHTPSDNASNSEMAHDIYHLMRLMDARKWWKCLTSRPRRGGRRTEMRCLESTRVEHHGPMPLRMPRKPWTSRWIRSRFLTATMQTCPVQRETIVQKATRIVGSQVDNVELTSLVSRESRRLLVSSVHFVKYMHS